MRFVCADNVSWSCRRSEWSNVKAFNQFLFSSSARLSAIHKSSFLFSSLFLLHHRQSFSLSANFLLLGVLKSVSGKFTTIDSRIDCGDDVTDDEVDGISDGDDARVVAAALAVMAVCDCINCCFSSRSCTCSATLCVSASLSGKGADRSPGDDDVGERSCIRLRMILRCTWSFSASR